MTPRVESTASGPLPNADGPLQVLRRAPAFALRQAWRQGYTRNDLRADVLSGLVVGIVALPLAMALAIATGVAPQQGIYTAIVAGAVIALLGGSRVQVSGPTAAFVVILAPIVQQYGLGGLCLATSMAGVILLVMGLARLGRMIEFIPYPVTTGFTAGIGVVIAMLQVKDFLGLTVVRAPENFIERLEGLAAALPSWRWEDALVGSLTLGILLLWPRFGPGVARKVPSPLVAVSIAALAAWLLHRLWPTFEVATIASRFTWSLPSGASGTGVPPAIPGLVLPWLLPGPDGQPLQPSLHLIESLLPSAFAIAMLGAIESLLSAVVADGMIGFKHDPDAELLAQGAGNLVAPFFGGIAATGAIARTATNVRSGGRSPIASLVHAGFLLLAVLAFAPLLGYLPMASMAALLLLVAWNMAELRHVTKMVRIAPRSDVLVLLTCLSLTVVFDMVVAVVIGVLLATVLFIRRMVEVSNVRLVGEGHGQQDVPSGVMLYDIAGPLFFGAAQKAMSAVRTAGSGVQVVLLDLRDVPAMDATGLVNLESALEDLRQRRIGVVLAGVQPQPLNVLRRGGVIGREGVAVCERFEDGLAHAARLSEAAAACASQPMGKSLRRAHGE